MVDPITPEAEPNQPGGQIDVPIEGLPAEFQNPNIPQPEGDQPPAPSQPKMVTWRYKGKDYQVPKETLSAIDEREQAFQSGIEKEKAEKEAIIQSLQANSLPANQNASEEDKEELLARLLDNPKEVLAEIKEEAKAELRTEYSQHESIKSAETAFWGQNQELTPHKDMFDGFWLANAARWQAEGKTDSQAREECAELVRTKLLQIQGKAPTARPTPHIESGGELPADEPETPPVKIKTISDLTREKQIRERLGPQAASAPG